MMDTNAKRDQVHECFRAADDMGLVWIASDCLDHIDVLTAENKKLLDRITSAKKLLATCTPETIGDEVLIKLLIDALARDAIKEPTDE